MLAQIQILSKVLTSQDYSTIQDNLLDVSYFTGYENEYNFIKEHYEKYKKVPDELSFLDKFPEFDIVEVNDSDRYLVSTIREQHLFMKFTNVMPDIADMLKSGQSNEARDYLLNLLKTDLVSEYTIDDVGIVASISDRVEKSEFSTENFSANFIPTGFDEIDNDIYGLSRGNELVVIFARINQGKSWVLEKICENAVALGYKVGYFSPEMSVEQVGYRFDTLYGNVPNSSVLYGKYSDDYSLDDYKKYAEELSGLTGELYATTPKDFNRNLTVTKLRNWVTTRDLNMLAIDGITYLTDERFRRGDSKTTSLTHISEDLMDLSAELGIPILVVVQSNRGGVVDKNSLDTPELENIKDSDGIAANASRVFSVRQLKDKLDKTILIIDNKKSRTGQVGQSYRYEWDINTGHFYPRNTVDLPDSDDSGVKVRTRSEVKGATKRRSNAEDEF